MPPELRRGDTTTSSAFRAHRLTDIPAAFGLSCATFDGADVKGLFALVEQVTSSVRAKRTCHFVEVRTSRYPGNMGFWPQLVGEETDLVWALGEGEPPEALAAWSRESDPLMLFVQELLSSGAVTRKQLMAIDANVKARIEQAMEHAIKSPQPPAEEAYLNVWAGEGNRG